jgi:hypothetical protein
MKKLQVMIALAFVWTIVSVISADAQSNKIDVCHRISDRFHKISVGGNAFQGHMAHGDVVPGQTVLGNQLQEYDTLCSIVQAKPDFVSFNIRNNNTTSGGSISPPWDSDMSLVENSEGDGFSATTPQGGQKVGYGTNFFDGLQFNKLQSTDFLKVSGAPNPPYLNIWVTDGGGKYAVIASENSYMGTTFATRQEWKVFETNLGDLSWLCATGVGTRDSNQYLTCNGIRVTMADFANSVLISSPSTYSAPHVGSGAPRGGYGFNLIYGDTQSNFIGAYTLNSLTVFYDGVIYTASN